MSDSRLSERAGLMRPSALRELLSTGTLPQVSLAGGLPPTEAFPFQTIGHVVAELMAAGDVRSLQYTSAEGDSGLRRQVAELLTASHDTTVEASRVIITTGSQQGIDMVARVLLDPLDVAVVESPTYVGALRSLTPTGATIVAVPSDGSGMDTAALERELAAGLRPKLCYLVANFSNPGGATLSAERRVHLAALAERFDFVIVEDDQYGRLRFAGTPLAPIASLSDRVVYLSGFSKVIAPGLRVGYLAAPEWLVRPLVMAKQGADLAASSLGQRIVSRLLEMPEWWDTHLADLRTLYARRHEALLAAIDARLNGRLTARPSEGGMFVWSTIHRGVTAEALVGACRRHGVALVAGNEFSVNGGFDHELRLSYSTLTPGELDQAVELIGLALDDLA